MAYIFFTVEHQIITRSDNFRPVNRSQNYLHAKFTFIGDEWAGLIKTAEFKNGKNGTPYSVLLSDDECEVPHEVLAGNDKYVYVSVFAGNLITVNVEKFFLETSGYWQNAVPSVDPTPSVYTQIINRLEGVENNVTESARSASTSATNAHNSEVNAAVSESNALQSEQNAATSETNARSYANSANTSAGRAGASESNASSYASNASASAQSASASESNAKSYMESAEGYKTQTQEIVANQQDVLDALTAGVNRAEGAANEIKNMTVTAESVSETPTVSWSNGVLSFGLPKGDSGNDGEDGNGIESAELNDDYTLTLYFTDGTSYTTPSIQGDQGIRGIQGKDGNGIKSVVLNNDYTLTITLDDNTAYTTASIRGASGSDGVSPSVSVSSITGGHSVSITDSSGTETFNVLDGEDGSAPVKGTDYWTTADKEEIVSDAVDELSPIIADEYDSTQTYALGDYCIHEGVLCRCTTAISTAEAWTSGHWTAVALADDVSNLKTAFSDLATATASDVGKALSPKTVTNGEVTEWQYVETGGGGGGTDYELISTDATVALTKTVPAEASKAEIESTGTKSIIYNQHVPALSLTNKNGLDYTTDTTTGWTTVSGTSSANSGFRPAGNDIIPLGHVGAVIIDLDGITLQTSLSNGFEAILTSGPGYNDGVVRSTLTGSCLYQSDSWTWGLGFRCGSGNSVNGKIRAQVFDLTVMFGEGNEPSTVNDFLAIFTGDYYPPDATGTTTVISCDKILLNGVEKSGTSFDVEEDDVITIHTSCGINGIVIPVASTVKYYKIAGGGGDEGETPAYVAESAGVTTDLLNEQADLRIMLFTDNHDYTPFKYEKYADMMSHGIVDYLVGLGDYKDYSTSHDKIWYKTNLLNALTKAGREANCLYVVGNHDVGIKGVQGAPNSVDYLLTPMECYDVLNRNYSKNPAIVFDEENPFGGYYYLDDNASKIRMIILQSSDIFKDDGSFVRYKDELMFMSQKQLTWFCEKACKLNKSDTTGWGIIVFIHCDKPYGSTNNSLFKILNAVKNGTSITETFTVYNRMTLDNGTWTTTRDEVNSDTLEIDSDYTSQGAVDVLGVIHGHGHADDESTIQTINDIQVRCDNGNLDDYYLAPVNGITAGTYCFTDIDGKKWAITYTTSYNDVAYIGYNHYFSNANVSPMPISRYDSNKNRIRSNSGCSLVDAYPAGATEVTDFFRERGDTVIGMESAEILCIDKENRTLTFIPYGTAEKHSVTY